MTSNRKSPLFFVACVLIVASLACQFSVGNVDEGGVAGVTSATTCKAVDADQKCEGQANVFDGVETIYVSVQVANLSEGDRVTVRWFQGTDQIEEFTLPMDRAGSGYLSFSLAPSSPFPLGEYAAQIFLNDSLAQTAKFQIAGESEAEPTATEVPAVEEPTAMPVENTVQSVTTCRSVTADFQCEGQTTTFGPEDTMYASVEVVDAPVSLVITARWLQGAEVVDEADFPVDAGGSGFIGFNLTPDNVFLPGDYAVEIYVDDSLVDRIDLLVEGVAEEAPPEGDVSAADWETHESDLWQITVDYPPEWEVFEDKDALLFVGEGKTSFYLTGYGAEDSAEVENQSAIQLALDNLTAQFEDFQSTEVEPFQVGGVPGLTSDYAYTDGDGDFLNGSVLVGTSETGNTYIVYIEALAGDYEAALEDFNGMLQTLIFR